MYYFNIQTRFLSFLFGIFAAQIYKFILYLIY